MAGNHISTFISHTNHPFCSANGKVDVWGQQIFSFSILNIDKHNTTKCHCLSGPATIVSLFHVPSPTQDILSLLGYFSSFL